MSILKEVVAAYTEARDMKVIDIPFYVVSKEQFRASLDLGLVSYKEGKHYFVDGKEIVVARMEGL